MEFPALGRYKLPYKGMRIELTPENRMLYGSLLRGPERVADPDKLTSYVFQKDYYFMLGDNRGNSLDSRFLGPFPLAVSRQGFYMLISMVGESCFFARPECVDK